MVERDRADFSLTLGAQQLFSHPVLRRRLEPLFMHRRADIEIELSRLFRWEDVLLNLSTSSCGIGWRCEASSMTASRNSTPASDQLAIQLVIAFLVIQLAIAFNVTAQNNRHNINYTHYLIAPKKTIEKKKQHRHLKQTFQNYSSSHSGERVLPPSSSLVRISDFFV